MKSKLTKKHLDYLVLLLAAALTITLTMSFSPNKQILTLVIIAFAVFYFHWGIIHHKFESSLHPEVILEYLLFAALGALLILGLI